MQAAKQKMSDMASAAKEKAKIYEAKLTEKAETAAASTKLEKEIAHERAKAKEAEAKMELHQEKAQHREKRAHHVPLGAHAALDVEGHNHPPAAGANPTTATTTSVLPTYPASAGYPSAAARKDYM